QVVRRQLAVRWSRRRVARAAGVSDPAQEPAPLPDRAPPVAEAALEQDERGAAGLALVAQHLPALDAPAHDGADVPLQVLQRHVLEERMALQLLAGDLVVLVRRAQPFLAPARLHRSAEDQRIGRA